ncbi:MAG: hypothetical protein K8S87_07480 [Planctomycetes bacterium]|nr:hypothetical protein [Planctomycetota bacterium]
MPEKKKLGVIPQPSSDFAKKYRDLDEESPERIRNSKFRNWLEDFIKNNKLHNRDVGELFGVNDSLIGHYRKGTRLPTYTTLQRIKIATGIDMNDLFDDEIGDFL